jgi:phosphoenolpyruvate carboxykinase (ATP)
MEKIVRYGTPVYLVNTGWTGGAYEAGGRRFSIATTRSIVHAIQRGEIEHAPQRELPGLGLKVPTHVRGVDDHILDPRSTWADPDAYDRAARELTERFIENFRRFEVGPEILAAGPRL